MLGVVEKQRRREERAKKALERVSSGTIWINGDFLEVFADKGRVSGIQLTPIH